MRTGKEWLGWAEGPEGPFVAGSYCSYKIIYHVGRYGLDDSGRIRIARRSVSDTMRPQLDDPKAPGYTTVRTNRDVKLEAAFVPMMRGARQEAGFTPIIGSVRAGHIRPFSSAFQVDVRDGSLYEGDTIEVTFGDQSGGSPGLRVQSFREQEHIFKVFVDPFGTGLYKEVDGSPRIRIIGGPANEIQVVAPSKVVVGSEFKVTARALDTNGNRSDGYRGAITFESDDPEATLPENYVFKEADVGAKTFRGVALSTPGVQHITISDDQGRRGVSNPVMVLEEPPEYNLYWGDMHGQTKQTVGTGEVPEYFAFARDVAALDFGAWQGNDFQVTAGLWSHVKETVREFYDPGGFVTFLGYEWSGLTPGGGDHNIYYLGEDEAIYRSDQWLIEEKLDPETDRYPISELWETFKGRRDVLAIPHVGGRHGNLDYYDPERIPLVEVHSHHGTFEWFLLEAMRRRLKVGFIAASDDHTCRPGLSYPSRGFSTKGGYTGIYAKELTREGVWEALWARRAYATSGERIILEVESEGHLMGEEYSTNKFPEINVSIVGTAPLCEVEVWNWDRPVFRHPFAEPIDESERLIKVEWSGARVRSRPKVVNWDGGLYIEDGRIVEFSEFAFDYPDQGVQMVSNRELRWRSTTGGDPDGVILKLESGDESEVTFHTGPVTFKFRPREIGYEPEIVEAGGLNQRVKVSTVKEDLPDTLEFTYRDQAPEKGLNAYWVRLVQSDGGMAWSSPIFIGYTG